MESNGSQRDVDAASPAPAGEVRELALDAKRRLVTQLADTVRARGLSKRVLARRMGTSRSALDRLLDPANPSLTLATLARAAHALGASVRIVLD